MNAEIADLHRILGQAREQVGKVVIGQRDAVDKALVVIVTGHHALIEGVPGIAKTLLVRTLAAVLGTEFGRVQFTPDLMPTDITGTHVFDLQQNRFNLVRGPVFTSFLLADEINRAPAKTQAALLEAMQERTVTIDRDTHVLPPNFTVFATQNPIEYEGTYPLPEAQKDRFMLKIVMDCPAAEEELELASRMLDEAVAPESVLRSGQVQAVLDGAEIAKLRQILSAVVVREELIEYCVNLVRQTRVTDSVLVGAGPRATQALVLASRAVAALAERDFVTPDDVKQMAGPVLAHRLVLRPEYEIEGLGVGEVIGRILEEVTVPR